VLDKNILQEMSRGVSSYDDLAQKLNVNRSTIYRRVRALERSKIISRQTRVSVNFAKLDLISILIGANISNDNAPRVIAYLSGHPCVKMIWQAFGVYNLFAVLFCEKGDEGNKIFEIRKILEDLQVDLFDISVGFKWQKMETTPF
jgi:DNA-binding Lrp family transcriptional regulator